MNNRANEQDAELVVAVAELLSDDDMPTHWDDCVCSYCVRYRRVKAALAAARAGEDTAK